MIRTVTQRTLTPLQKVFVRTLAIILAIISSMLIMLCLKLNPFTVYAKLIVGSLGSAYRFRETVNKAIPLTMLSLGTCIAFKMKFWNIGAEGQFYMGAFGATWMVFLFPTLPLWRS